MADVQVFARPKIAQGASVDVMAAVPDQTDAAYNRSALLGVSSAVGTVDSAYLYTVARCVLLILGPSRFRMAKVYFFARQG